MRDDKKDTTLTATIHVSVKLGESTAGERSPNPVAYAFTANGRFLAQAPVDEQGNAQLTVPAAQNTQEVRVVVGPSEDDADRKPPSLAQLSRKNSPERWLRVSAATTDLRAVFEIPRDIWICWHRLCRVAGTLLKRIYSSGIAVDYPVVNADVQIWEVDPVYIILSALTDVQLDRIGKYFLNPQPLPPDPPDFRLRATSPRLGQMAIAEPVPQLREFSSASPEFEQLHRIALTGNLTALRQELTAINPDALAI